MIFKIFFINSFCNIDVSIFSEEPDEKPVSVEHPRGDVTTLSLSSHVELYRFLHVVCPVPPLQYCKKEEEEEEEMIRSQTLKRQRFSSLFFFSFHKLSAWTGHRC